MSNQSKSEKVLEELSNEIKEKLDSKDDKTSPQLNGKILSRIREMKEKNESKDDIGFEIIVNFKVKPQIFEIHWKSLQQSQSYRDRTIEMFLERMNPEDENDLSKIEEFTLDQWSKEMLGGEYLKKIENYKQHFIVYKSLFLRKNLMR